MLRLTKVWCVNTDNETNNNNNADTNNITIGLSVDWLNFAGEPLKCAKALNLTFYTFGTWLSNATLRFLSLADQK